MACKVEFRNVSFRYGQDIILDNISLTVEPGRVVMFGGRSGCGKSALLEICAGLLNPSGGRVLWDGENMTGIPRYELYSRRRSMGYVFQMHALITNHTVFDNIALPLKCGTDLSGERIKNKVWSQMDELGISRGIEKRFPEALSAAQLRSVAIARALINDPKLLLLDEPLTGVDPLTANTITGVLHERWKRDGMSIIMATHSLCGWPEQDTEHFMLKDGRFEPAAEALEEERKYDNAE